jgi:hypothetical protein
MDNLPAEINTAIDEMNELFRQEDAVKTQMKPMKSELKVITGNKKTAMAILVEHLKTHGGTLAGDGWEISPNVRQKKTFTIQELEGVINEEVLQSLMPEEDEVVFPVKKKRRQS